MRHLRAIILALLLPALAAPALAQGHVRAMGMGNAGTAAARGLAAVDWNPANLVMNRKGEVNVGLASVAVDVHNNSFSLDRYNQVTGAVLTEADKQVLLGDIPMDGLILDANVRASALGFCAGSFAFSLQGIAGGSGTLDRDFFDLILMGNSIGQSFSFDDTDGEASAMAAATLSWATPLVTRRTHRLSLGVNARYLHGLYDFRVESATGGISTDFDAVKGEAEASYVTSRGGTGWAMDLGMTLQAPRGWTFGLAVDNLAGALNWDTDVERHVWSATADSINASTDDIEDQVVESESTAAGDPYTSDLPGRLRVGASNRLGMILYAADVAMPLDDRPAAGGTELSVGVELQIASWFRPRFGAATGGPAGRRSSVGLGLGLGPLRWDVAVANQGGWVPEDTKGLSVASGLGMAF
ncbi:MAG TPA: DUF5723 family protein [Candidatus Krumholzibacteria bacterium]|nr:DUF5723 family protein [Candidatus Krumholzibacteria bacterium]HRX50337.1 DUF5723 family protein [Candidatus Krumholzibacteria bacterium]